MSEQRHESSRREFLRRVGKKSLYVTPAVLTVTAAQSHAASGDFFSNCGDPGSPCTVDADCCTNECGGPPSNRTCMGMI